LPNQRSKTDSYQDEFFSGLGSSQERRAIVVMMCWRMQPSNEIGDGIWE